MTTKSPAGKKTVTAGSRTKRRAPPLASLIAAAADLQRRAAKLHADLLACKKAGNTYGGDVTTNKGRN